ncbi:MAG: glycosyltransferase family 4 protein [Synechococcaceae cyanobacterium RL_1_2]|nr:glycosyltransferase family 4 protein [Synechococcaceae cyanobacterium RL_1_2]
MTEFYPPDYAATGQLIDELARSLECNGWDVDVFTSQPGYAFDQQQADKKQQIGSLTIKRSSSARFIPSRIRGKAINGLIFFIRSLTHTLWHRNNQDLLLVTTAPPFLPILAYLNKLFCNKSYVCLIYDLYPDVLQELNILPAHHWLVRCWIGINKLVWRNAQSVIVLSTTMKQRILNHSPGLKTPIHVIHNWIDVEKIYPVAKADNWFIRANNLPDKFTVVYSGNLGRCHDLETIMEAARLLKEKAVQFVFIGGGAKVSYCQQEVQAHQLSNCTFLPYQDKKDLPFSLSSGDLSLVSIAEGMEGVVVPSKVYGMLAVGRPIAAICEENSYIRSMCDQGQFGQCFNNGDGENLANFILDLAKDQNKAQIMGQNARNYVEQNFTADIITTKYREVLTSALN